MKHVHGIPFTKSKIDEQETSHCMRYVTSVFSTEANERIFLHSKDLNMFTDCTVYSRIGSVIHRLCVKPGLVPLGLTQRTRLLSVKQFYRIRCVYL